MTNALDAIQIEVKEEFLEETREIVKKELARRAYVILGQAPPVFDVREGQSVYVICNAIVREVDEEGNIVTRRNVEFWYNFERENSTFKATGGMLPIQFPWLIGKIKVVDG